MDSQMYYFQSAATGVQADTAASIFDEASAAFGGSRLRLYGTKASELKTQADFPQDWSSPFSEDFREWAVDEDTTEEPGSDGCYQVGSSSDEDSELQAPWAHGSMTWKTHNNFHGKQEPFSSIHGETQSVGALRPPSLAQESLAPTSSSVREQLPEEGLVDIDPEEGMRRGRELLSMLSIGEDAQDDHDALKSSQSAAASQSSMSASASAFTPARASSGAAQCTPAASPESVMALRHASALQQAARDAYGSLLEDITMDENGAYAIYLHRPGQRQYDEVAVLTALRKSLWPLLGREVSALEPAMMTGRHPRLVMVIVGNGSEDSQFCWEFATSGACPRGSRCRWEHTTGHISHTYIDVIF